MLLQLDISKGLKTIKPFLRTANVALHDKKTFSVSGGSFELADFANAYKIEKAQKC